MYHWVDLVIIVIFRFSWQHTSFQDNRRPIYKLQNYCHKSTRGPLLTCVNIRECGELKYSPSWKTLTKISTKSHSSTVKTVYRLQNCFTYTIKCTLFNIILMPIQSIDLHSKALIVTQHGCKRHHTTHSPSIMQQQSSTKKEVQWQQLTSAETLVITL